MKILNPGYESETIGGSLYWNNQSGKCYHGQFNMTTTCDFTSTGLKDKLKSLIGAAVWNTGSQGKNDYGSVSNGLAKHFYTYERSSNNGKICSSGNYCTDKIKRTTKWTGKVGLMYPSDYGYATSGGSTTDREACLNTALVNWRDSDISDCKNNSWLYMQNNAQWVLTPYATSSIAFYTFKVGEDGSVHGEYASYSHAVLPVVYLTSNVGVQSGDGSMGNPFILG